MQGEKSNLQTNQTTQGEITLARTLTGFDATMIGIGAMIGAGVFVLTGIATGEAGPAAIIAFGLNGIVTLFTALTYAELAAAYGRYAKEVNLIEVPDDYNPVIQVQKNVARNQGEEATDKVPILD